MAHFRGTLQGHRGRASRLGTKKSGLTVTANGWHIGVSVSVQYDEKADQDIVSVRLTGGSNGGFGGRCLGTFKEKEIMGVAK